MGGILMKRGYLSEYFTGVAIKTLSAVEADVTRSHQHEFNGVTGLMGILGQVRREFPARFLYLRDDDEAPVTADGFLTWYDAREAHPTRSEYRLYFKSSSVSKCALAGDLLVIGRRPNDSLLVVVVEGGSTTANQIRWLFGFTDLLGTGFSIRTNDDAERIRLEYASQMILSQIGIEPTETAGEQKFLETILAKFGARFPTTREFSDFARSTLRIDPRDDPDMAIVAWMEREEVLFRALERHLTSERLRTGFDGDVDGFVSFSLSVQNRRKSRVGAAFENHVEEIFRKLCIRYDRTKITEQKNRPDFIFPGISEYQDATFPTDQLTMLGVKSTCKDRWRQILAEADRIQEKHLLTLEPSISIAQTTEMDSKRVQLILPIALHGSFSELQKDKLISVRSFCELVAHRQ